MIRKLKKLLKKAVERCYHDDNFLITKEMERASVARILIYMQELINADIEFAQFREYNLDSEYNKLGTNSKIIPCRAKTSFLDIALHKRNQKDNLLAVEFKCENTYGEEDDFEKLSDYTANNGDYAYILGVFVRLNKDKAIYTCFRDGRQVEEPTANLISGNTNE